MHLERSHWTLRGVAGTRPEKLAWRRDRGAGHMTVSHTFKIRADGPSRTAEKISKTQNHVLRGCSRVVASASSVKKKRVRSFSSSVSRSEQLAAQVPAQLAAQHSWLCSWLVRKLYNLALSLALPKRIEATKSISSGKCIPRIKPKFSSGNDCSEFRGINSLANCFEFKRVKGPRGDRRPAFQAQKISAHSSAFHSVENGPVA